MSTECFRRSVRATLIGMVVNTVLALTKFAAGVIGHSNALIADAVESLADIFSSLVVWRGLVIADAPADPEHPYGHGKAEPIAAAIVSTMLLLAAVGIAGGAGRSILAPHLAPRPFTLLVLLGVVVIKETLFRFVIREGAAAGSSAVRTDAWHHRSDAITSLAAAVGITISLVGGPGWAAADDVAAVVAAGIIAWNGWRLLRPALDELMDAAPGPELIAQIRQHAGGVAGVHAVEKCLVRKVGLHFFVDMHLEVDPLMTVAAAHQVAHVVKDHVRSRLPTVRDVLVHIEPARSEDTATPAGASAAIAIPPR